MIQNGRARCARSPAQVSAFVSPRCPMHSRPRWSIGAPCRAASPTIRTGSLCDSRRSVPTATLRARDRFACGQARLHRTRSHCVCGAPRLAAGRRVCRHTPGRRKRRPLKKQSCAANAHQLHAQRAVHHSGHDAIHKLLPLMSILVCVPTDQQDRGDAAEIGGESPGGVSDRNAMWRKSLGVRS